MVLERFQMPSKHRLEASAREEIVETLVGKWGYTRTRRWAIGIGNLTEKMTLEVDAYRCVRVCTAIYMF